jgi:hypothetical protein
MEYTCQNSMIKLKTIPLECNTLVRIAWLNLRQYPLNGIHSDKCITFKGYCLKFSHAIPTSVLHSRGIVLSLIMLFWQVYYIPGVLYTCQNSMIKFKTIPLQCNTLVRIAWINLWQYPWNVIFWQVYYIQGVLSEA